MLARMQSDPSKMIKQHTAHFESMCRHLVRDGGAMAAMHGLQADLLLLDALFSCAFPVSASLDVPTVLFGPTDVLDPFWSVLYGLPYSPAVHTFMGSGLAYPLNYWQRAMNALLSPLVYRLGMAPVTGSSARIAEELKLPSFETGAVFQSAKLFLAHSVTGFGPARSLPPNFKARMFLGCVGSF
jgi:hypothetical protein